MRTLEKKQRPLIWNKERYFWEIDWSKDKRELENYLCFNCQGEIPTSNKKFIKCRDWATLTPAQLEKKIGFRCSKCSSEYSLSTYIAKSKSPEAVRQLWNRIIAQTIAINSTNQLSVTIKVEQKGPISGSGHIGPIGGGLTIERLKTEQKLGKCATEKCKKDLSQTIKFADEDERVIVCINCGKQYLLKEELKEKPI